MSSYSFTLGDLKASEWGEHPMADIAFGMKDSGFHRWGFAIYRTSYGDDAAWDRYLEVLRQSAQKYLERTGGDVLLEQYMDWPVISDPVGLNGASKAEVRRHFRDWCASRSEERDGAGATRDSVARLPRFKHCLYVDHKCLDTLANLPANYSELQSRRKRLKSNVLVVVLDGTFEEGATGGSGQGLVPEVEGCSEWYVGWRYEPLDSVITTYKESHDSSSVDLLNEDGLEAVCEDTCRQSLVDLRTKISSACEEETDTIHYGYMTYPATYIAERYLYFYDVSCYKDISSGQFCDAVVAGWRNETGGSAAHMCEDCWLGPLSVQLSSPIGYDEERARHFASLTSSCSVDTYTVATPAPYGEPDHTIASLLTTAAAATTTPSTGDVSTASEVSSSVETPMIYPLLELGTSASSDTGVDLAN